MDEALKSGAKGVSIFTVGSLRSSEIRQQFKAYADSARASRDALKGKPEMAIARVANANPFENKGIMSAARMRMLAWISLANAMELPELKRTDQTLIDRVSGNALQANTADDYINRLTNSSRRNQELQPVARTIAEQFIRDTATVNPEPGSYNLIEEYGATKCYQVTEQNSKVVFDVTFYLYGGIISGWSIEPEKETYQKYLKENRKL
jgi:hypothetical protein